MKLYLEESMTTDELLGILNISNRCTASCFICKTDNAPLTALVHCNEVKHVQHDLELHYVCNSCGTKWSLNHKITTSIHSVRTY